MTAITPGPIRNAAPQALSQVDRLGGATSATPWGTEHPGSTCAVVLSVEQGNARIECEGQVRAARIAFGCLVRPEPGDSVLIGTASGTTWIISVLERPTDAPPLLWAKGDIGIASAAGDISLMAAREVHIDAGARVRTAAPEIDLHAGIARFVLDELLHVGRRISLQVAKLRSVGEIVETFAEHVLTRATRSSRFIEESDQVHAGDIDYSADGNLQLEAETAFITADTVVRVDAEQIHMG